VFEPIRSSELCKVSPSSRAYLSTVRAIKYKYFNFFFNIGNHHLFSRIFESLQKKKTNHNVEASQEIIGKQKKVYCYSNMQLELYSGIKEENKKKKEVKIITN
jgi:hypothetical protein